MKNIINIIIIIFTILLQALLITVILAPPVFAQGAAGCSTTAPYNGVACKVHPPGSQCAADYQWCFDGCCRFTGTTTSSTPTTTPTPAGSTPTPVPGSGNPPQGSKCDYDILDKSGSSIKSGPVYEMELYTFKVTMQNTVKEGTAADWTKATHKLQATGNTASLWGIPQTYELPKDTVPQGQSAVFNIDFSPRPVPSGDKTYVDRPASFQMADTGGLFGSACEPEIRVQRKPPGLISTLCYVISEDASDVNDVKDCDNPLAKPYPSDPATIDFILSKTAGTKTIYVKFFDNNNRPSNNNVPFTRTVVYSPDPSISGVDCSYGDSSGLGTIFTIKGSGFGSQTIGSKVKIGNQEGQIDSWSSTSITARADQRLEGATAVQVILEDDRKDDASCTVGLTTATLSVKSQCATTGQFDISDVEVKIFKSGPEPFAKHTIRTDKEGNAQGFAPKLEKNKTYSTVIKAPGTLAKKVDFTTGTGTSIIGPVVLPAGNIAPSPVVDNVINSFDVNALYSQWSLTKDISRPGDLNKDGRVNSIDYACLKLNFNKSDEGFTSPTPTPTPTPTSTPTPTPTPTPGQTMNFHYEKHLSCIKDKNILG